MVKMPVGKDKTMPLATSLPSGTKQYGLVLSKKNSLKKKELSSSFNAFAAAAKEKHKQKEAEDETDVRRRVGLEAARSLQQNQVDRVRAQALAEDAAVFEYDAVYDDIKSAREREAMKHAAKREMEKKKPKYIRTLLQQAKIREVENERIRERRLLHERHADDAQYGDKEKLVSASYKRKLQEMQKWDAEDARLAAMEEHEDVTKQGEHAMAGFYVNLNKNIAMGGTTANARSAYTPKETQTVKDRSVEPARAERGHEIDGAIELESKTHDDGATKKARSVERSDEHSSSSIRDIMKDVHVKTNATMRQTEEFKEPKASKEDAIAAARARFLARKAQQKSSTT
ncbi:hypothetical protein DD238_003503 [Peronospora effusa]|uniref:Nuclear speckle splicing regulatory protein 1 N-terminal domain-containing protein n=1 Tax=Peronospora effusa TaxID=542832 RepID=A0A3M6VSI0_9STRA|nr:hypothetical protein DD238_003503 [Peronospora effusa]RQM10856.1 hypothetical protein DD237_004640 [Peronospora effusa]